MNRTTNLQFVVVSHGLESTDNLVKDRRVLYPDVNKNNIIAEHWSETDKKVLFRCKAVIVDLIQLNPNNFYVRFHRFFCINVDIVAETSQEVCSNNESLLVMEQL